MEKPLTRNIPSNGDGPLPLKAYEKAGGYESVRSALRMTPAAITDLVTKSKLRGRGGAGFSDRHEVELRPHGKDAPHPKYLVANADEMEPGTFKDRLLLEGDPHQLIEGMIVAAYAIEADIAYIFLRAEYTLAAERLATALAEAYASRYLGRNILGSGYNLEMYLHVSAGRYMCGEETGLLNSLEGKRANPRSKPPFPPVSGLWGKPTIVQNVETLCNVPHIINHGAEWFKSLSLTSRWGNEALWRKWQGQTSRVVGAPARHNHPRNPGRTRGRDARRCEASRPASRRRFDRLSYRATSGRAHGFQRSTESGQPAGHRNHDCAG